MFLVWQQERAGRLGALDAERQGLEVGSFDVRTNLGDIFAVQPTNALVFKMTYWFNP